MSGDAHADLLAVQASLMIDQRNYLQAMALLRQALALHPDHGEALYFMAFCQLQSDRDSGRALATVNLALAAEPHNSRYHSLKAAILCARNDYSGALSSANDAIAVDPAEKYGYIEKGRTLVAMQRWKDAEVALHEALALDAEDATAGNLLTVALQYQNRSDETEQRIHRSLSRDPHDSYAHANAGWSALRKGDLQQAEFHFREALRIEPENEHARRGVIETFKARSPIYRIYLKYCFTMGRLQPRHQIFVIVGLMLAYRLSRRVFTGSMQPVGTIIGAAYLLFVLWSWVAHGVGNLLLLFNSFARRALRRNEKIEGVLVGGNVMLGLPVYLIGLAAGLQGIYPHGFLMIASAFPFSATFTNDRKAGKWFYGISGAYIWVMNIAALIIAFSPLPPHIGNMCFNSATILAMVSILMGAFGILRR